jgi:hypothetical protein
MGNKKTLPMNKIFIDFNRFLKLKNKNFNEHFTNKAVFLPFWQQPNPYQTYTKRLNKRGYLEDQSEILSGHPSQ